MPADTAKEQVPTFSPQLKKLKHIAMKMMPEDARISYISKRLEKGGRL